ncbi:MAG TPA: hypothetical protein VFN76_06825 [Candidatus Limnocylindria bacterium]|nr:hypothetical protein [Candidatus Limnocylindria bacterium]
MRADRWTPRKAVVAAFVALFLIVQLTVPLVMLAVRGGGPGGPPSGELPLSWQMYTVVPPVGEIEITRSDGSTTVRDAIAALGAIGSRMAYDVGVLEAGCRLDASATMVSIIFVGRERAARC